MTISTRMRLAVLFACVIGALPGNAHAAAILQVNADGRLTGAKDVNVDGHLYDVQFVEGSCIALFDGCDDVSDFVFATEADARAASDALVTQVLVDLVPVGLFDTVPELTMGCLDTFSCAILTPYALWGDMFGAAVAYNLASTDSVGGAAFLMRVTDTFTLPSHVFADWNPGSRNVEEIEQLAAVPEPASLFLLGTGLAAVASASRRRKSGAGERGSGGSATA